MIRESFIFLPKVKEATERKIWAQAPDWNAFLDRKEIAGFSEKRKQDADMIISSARDATLQDNARWLGRIFPKSDHWRLYDHFKERAAFLDIETSKPGTVTLVGIYDGRETKSFLHGTNLDRKSLADELAKYQMLVTFNGASFDLPVLKHYFQLPFDVPHVDLKNVCAKVGLTGGLKSIERQMGIKRPETIKHVRGEDAAELWRCWKATGDKDFLDMLITYNEEDCVNLHTIAKQVIPQLWQQLRTPNPQL